MERNTHQKKVIIDTLMKLKGQHPTADVVYEQVRILIPSISKATVYRILNQIAEQGAIQRIHIPTAADRYDDSLEHHYHMLCECCGDVIDVKMPIIEGLYEQIPNAAEYIITGHDITFSGFCSQCYAKDEQCPSDSN